MEPYRQIIDGYKLAEVIDLPDELRKSELEVLIFPVNTQDKRAEEDRTIKLEDLPRHNMGRILTPLDREHIYIDER